MQFDRLTTQYHKSFFFTVVSIVTGIADFYVFIKHTRFKCIYWETSLTYCTEV